MFKMNELPIPFSKLPKDIWEYLLTLLEHRDIWNVSQSCGAFFHFFDEIFWQNAFYNWIKQNSLLPQIDPNQIEQNLNTYFKPKLQSQNVWKQRYHFLQISTSSDPKKNFSLRFREGKQGVQPFREYRFWILGDSGVGKSQLSYRFYGAPFYPNMEPSTCLDSFRKCIVCDEEPCITDFVETFGNLEEIIPEPDRNRVLASCFGTIIMYAINNRKSFQNVSKYLHLQFEMKFNTSPIILVGSKCDLEDERKVGFGEGVMLAKMIGASFFEISCKTSIGVQDLLCQIVREIRLWCLSLPDESLPEKPYENWRNQKPRRRKKKDCCIQ